MATLSELQAELAKMDEERDRASWQDYHLPSRFWVRYQQIDREIRQLDPREYVMGETGDGWMVRVCGWCSLAIPNHLPWCNEQADNESQARMAEKQL